MIHVGWTGRLVAGKGVASKFFVRNFDFVGISFGSIVREHALSRGLEDERNVLQQLGFDLRDKLAGMVIDKVKNTEDWERKNFSVDGYRYPAQYFEVRDYFKKYPSYLSALDASLETRYERMIERGRKGDPDNFVDFTKDDELDWKGHLIEKGQNVQDCFKIANRRIDTEGDVFDLYQTCFEIASHVGVYRREE